MLIKAFLVFLFSSAKIKCIKERAPQVSRVLSSVLGIKTREKKEKYAIAREKLERPVAI
jgi:hypothetical protein